LVFEEGGKPENPEENRRTQRKTGEPREKPSKHRREPTTNSTHELGPQR
jgi:hypothetical protein